MVSCQNVNREQLEKQVGADVCELDDPIDARVVDHNIEAAERGKLVPHKGFRGNRVGDVAAVRLCDTARGGDVLRRLNRRCLVDIVVNFGDAALGDGDRMGPAYRGSAPADGVTRPSR